MGAIDISFPLSPDMLHWPGQDPPSRRWIEQMADGGTADLSEWTIGAHAGTHVDAPAHFIGGAGTVDEIPTDALVGEAVVLDLADVAVIGAAVLEERLPPGVERVLFRTRNSADETATFREDYVALDAGGARVLLERGVRLVGNDYLSVERFGSIMAGAPVHRLLLGKGIVVLEGLRLGGVAPGRYQLVALPLRLVGAEASPARAVLYPRSR